MGLVKYEISSDQFNMTKIGAIVAGGVKECKDHLNYYIGIAQFGRKLFILSSMICIYFIADFFISKYFQHKWKKEAKL